MNSSSMPVDSRIPFFDTLARSWDKQQDLPVLAHALHDFFTTCNIQRDETILDIGCGTGNLTDALLTWLSPSGRVTAIDISPGMLSVARQKIQDSRVTWLQTSAETVPVADHSYDRLICFSAWPHFESPIAVANECYRILRPGGKAHLLHLISRHQVNHIHSQVHPSVQNDRLPPVQKVSELFQSAGFTVLEACEDHQRYLLTARKEKNIL